MEIICAHCGKKADKQSGAVNRSRRIGAPIYCGKTCSGLGRRKNLTKEQRVEAKRLYDIKYRAKNPRDPAERAAYFQRTYDPAKAAVERKKRMPRHVEYCRRPEYRQYKVEYDAKRRASEYGAFAEPYRLLLTLETEILTRMTRYEIDLANGQLCKAQRRRREYENTFRCKPEGSPLGHAQPNQGRQDAGEPG